MDKLYTYEEVKKILCDMCRLGDHGTRHVGSSHAGNWTHRVNDVSLECAASKWRNKEAISHTKGDAT